MTKPPTVQLHIGPIRYVKPKGARRPKTLDDLEAALGHPISEQWRQRMRELGMVRGDDDVIVWPDERVKGEVTA